MSVSLFIIFLLLTTLKTSLSSTMLLRSFTPSSSSSPPLTSRLEVFFALSLFLLVFIAHSLALSILNIASLLFSFTLFIMLIHLLFYSLSFSLSLSLSLSFSVTPLLPRPPVMNSAPQLVWDLLRPQQKTQSTTHTQSQPFHFLSLSLSLLPSLSLYSLAFFLLFSYLSFLLTFVLSLLLFVGVEQVVWKNPLAGRETECSICKLRKYVFFFFSRCN